MIEIIKLEKHHCRPCGVMELQLKVMENEIEGIDYTITKINVEDDPKGQEIIDELGLMGVPVLLFKKDGEIKDMFIGTASTGQIIEVMEKLGGTK
jgi:thioredoxin 1